MWSVHPRSVGSFISLCTKHQLVSSSLYIHLIITQKNNLSLYQSHPQHQYITMHQPRDDMYLIQATKSPYRVRPENNKRIEAQQESAQAIFCPTDTIN